MKFRLPPNVARELKPKNGRRKWIAWIEGQPKIYVEAQLFETSEIEADLALRGLWRDADDVWLYARRPFE